jgi:hypothetical protein
MALSLRSGRMLEKKKKKRSGHGITSILRFRV